MSKERSVLVAAYDDSDSAQHEYSVLKDELPKTGLVMDRSKVLVLASSDRPKRDQRGALRRGADRERCRARGRHGAEGKARSRERR